MLSLPPSVRVFVATMPVDMRRGFDTLAQMARTVFDQDPLSGHLFVFWSRRRDRVKILHWDRDGLALWYKRLEEGSFRFREDASGGMELSVPDLMLVLDGVDLSTVKRSRRYKRPPSKEAPA